MFTSRQRLAELVAELGLDRLTLMLGEQQRQARADVPQPPITITISPEDWLQVSTYYHTPLQPEEKEAGGIDILAQAVFDAVDSNSPEDTLFAALRLSRKMFALQPHLGPIEAGTVNMALRAPPAVQPSGE
jgi:hypothetical protein